MRFLSVLILTTMLAALAAQAQDDSVFDSYDDYATFVDTQLMARNFRALILRLGGRDEYTSEQLASNDRNLKNAWPRDFTDTSVFRRVDLGGGLWQEGRVYWTGMQYAYFYALLHDREDDFVVLSFQLNSGSKKIMDRF